MQFSDGQYSYSPGKWIISVENDGKTDMWYVSENFYDSVHIGDWVKK